MRKILSSIVVFSLLVVAGFSTVDAAPVSAAPAAVATASDSVHGARACFGVGTENCCGEFMVVGVMAAATGNLLALGIATVASYAYCY